MRPLTGSSAHRQNSERSQRIIYAAQTLVFAADEVALHYPSEAQDILATAIKLIRKEAGLTPPDLRLVK